jgi:glycosyltransferase involved in cell wall biosynthesis
MNESSAAIPLFSIIMNVYNGATYIRAAIDSVLAQTCPDWELVVWDDCSRDESVAICRSYQDPRIRLFVSETNVGLGAARNLVISETRGEWVAFLDQDDIWTADKLTG